VSGDNSNPTRVPISGLDTDCQLIIRVDRQTLTAQVIGPLANKAWCLAMLEMGKFAIVSFNAEGAQVTEAKVLGVTGQLPKFRS